MSTGLLTLSLRQATQAVIFRLMSGSFLSPNDTCNALAADWERHLDYMYV